MTTRTKYAIFTPDLLVRVFFQTNSAIDRRNIQAVFVYRYLPPFGQIQLAYQRGTAEFSIVSLWTESKSLAANIPGAPTSAPGRPSSLNTIPAALGIPMVGSTTSRLLNAEFASRTTLANQTRN